MTSGSGDEGAGEIPLAVVEPVLIDEIEVAPPRTPDLGALRAEPIYDIEVNVSTYPLPVTGPVLLEEELFDIVVEEDWVFRGPAGFQGLESVVTVIPEVRVEVEVSEEGLRRLERIWREKFKPISRSLERRAAPALAAPRLVDSPAVKRLLNIRLNFRYVSKEELAELLRGQFYQEYRVTRIVKRMEKIDSTRLVAELLLRIREKEEKLGLHRLFGRIVRRRRGSR